MIVIALFALALILYGAARHYSSSLVRYVVEQSLAQKAPPGTDPAALHERLQALLSAAPDPNAQMQRLLRISQYVEKVQRLTPGEFEELLAVEKQETSPVL